MELEALGKVKEDIKQAGGSLLAVSPQSVALNRTVRDEQKLNFEILSDPGNRIAHAFGIRHQLPPDLQALYLKFGIDLPEANGDESWTLPMPARYIIDRSGIIRYAAINADYTIRPEPAETVAALIAMHDA